MRKAKLYFGLLQAKDEKGTIDRIKAATESITPSELATEGRPGRSSQAESGSVVGIAKTVTGPESGGKWLYGDVALTDDQFLRRPLLYIHLLRLPHRMQM